MLKFLFLQTICFYLLIDICCNGSYDVKLVQILFRHGERSPSNSYKNDPHKDYPWPGGLNQLTTRGKHEMYDLGLRLREQYKNVLDEKYDLNNVLAFTSYADRCHMSGQLLLAGLYPPTLDQIWNPDLLWQPIPIHEIPRSMDNKIALKKKCPKYEKELKNVYESKKVQEINKNNADLYEYLKIHTGEDLIGIPQVELLYSILEIQKLNNLTLPTWTDNVFPEKMKDLHLLSLALFTETEFMKRMHGGMLVKEIIETMLNKTKEFNPLQLKLYSGHDLTIVSILNCLGLELIKPEFGASVIFELVKQDKYFVRLLLKENPYAEAKNINLPFCGDPCALDEFKLLSIVPNDWDDECILK